MDTQQKKWLYLLTLSLVWGSSFILMKKALIALTPIQVGALRMLTAALFLLSFGYKSLKEIQKKHYKYIFYTALLGTFFPSFLFAYAVNGIDSSIVSILNSLTPFYTLFFGAYIFGIQFRKTQFLGIIIGLIGTILLIIKSADVNPNQNYWFSILIVIASIGYALNVNIVKKYLSDISALSIVTGNFFILLIPAFIVLSCTDFFSSIEHTEGQLSALCYVVLLAIIGTGIAKVIYNKMVHLASPIFASSVTYLIPVVAVFWGVLDDEKLDQMQILAGFIILFGVYLLNRSK